MAPGDRQLAVHRVQILANDPQVEEYYAEVMRRFAELEQSPDEPKDDTETEQRDKTEGERLREEETPDEDQSANYGSSPGWTSPQRLGLHAWEDGCLNCNTQAGNDKRRTLSC